MAAPAWTRRGRRPTREVIGMALPSLSTDCTARRALTLEHADRWTWYPWINPARCHHVVSDFDHGTTGRLTNRCGGYGTALLADLPRCPATNKKTSRQCRLPICAGLGYSTCAAHRAEVR